jgi:hypothetical protein
VSVFRPAAAAIASVVCFGASGPAFNADAIRIIANDNGFEAPRTVSPGLRHIVFENHGTKIHEAMLIKLPPGMGVEGFREEVKKGALFPEGALDHSGPGLMSAGETTELWLRVDSGEYVLICWNHTRDSVRGFTVTKGESRDDTPPAEDATLVLRDFRFELRGRLKKGTQVIKIENRGPSLHEADLFRLHPDRVATDVQRWYKDELAGPAPADALGGVLDSHDIKRAVWLRRMFTPGRYMFHCGLPINLHARSGETSTIHADAGMVMTFEIDQ